MKVLVTGGTGVVGHAAVDSLRRRGHEVRLLSRHADVDARGWGAGVEAFAADLSDPSSLEGCAVGCDAVLHVAGIAAESPPELTFQRVNVQGTRSIVREADAAGARRLVFVSSLGADRGASDYHRSKHAAEAEVRRFGGEWVITRPGAVYGPGDEVVSLLLQMVRALPAVPIVDAGDQPFQPIWHADLGEALAAAVEGAAAAGRILELGGPEITSMEDLLSRLEAITGRRPARVPVPGPLAALATRVASGLETDFPVSDAMIQMLLEGNVVRPPAVNGLPELLHRAPTPLTEGLRMLADALPEQLPGEGVGDPRRKRFQARIVGSALSAAALCERFRERWAEIVPLESGMEPGAPEAAGLEIREGATLTMDLAGRGTVQVRCEEVTDRSFTLATVEGHPLAAILHFAFADGPDGLRFEILIYGRASSLPDLLTMSTVGDGMQDSTWTETVRRVVELSGGAAPEGVESESEVLRGTAADDLDRRIEEIVRSRRREREA